MPHVPCLYRSERNYSQLEKESLACVFGVKKLNAYVFGLPFDLITDHKPLLALLSECKASSPQASSRIKRRSLFLSSHEYTMMFHGTQSHGNAAALSRLPLATKPLEETQPPELGLVDHLSNSPVTAQQIRTWTARDSTLSCPNLRCSTTSDMNYLYLTDAFCGGLEWLCH